MVACCLARTGPSLNVVTYHSGSGYQILKTPIYSYAVIQALMSYFQFNNVINNCFYYCFMICFFNFFKLLSCLRSDIYLLAYKGV